jgi:hypothetical protein
MAIYSGYNCSILGGARWCALEIVEMRVSPLR